MKRKTHPFFRWPGSLVWLLPLLVVQLLFWRLDGVGTLWWYIATPTLVAFTFIDLFTSVWFGITILATLFLYCSIGSAGVPISYAIWEPSTWLNLREIRGLEMTEFEWFLWWPFRWLVAMLCLTMTIVTLRRIRLTVLTIGVWSIHTGVITMVIGCTIYFSQKIEGDVLISRCTIVIQEQDEVPVFMVVTPNNMVTIGDTTYTISNINPHWELMSGDDAGQEAYAVSVSVQGQGEMFIRQLIAGYPEYTEDVIRTDDPNQPMARAKKVIGRALFDENLVINLEYDATDMFFVTQSGALYLRELTSQGVPVTPWIERPVVHLPRFNDYLASNKSVWPQSGPNKDTSALSLSVPPASSDDPVQEHITVTSYLRYAFMDTRTVAGGSRLFPVAWLTLRREDETTQEVKLFALDPTLSTADNALMSFHWLESDNELEELASSLTPTLSATVGQVRYELELANTQEFVPIDDTGYAYRVNSIQNNLNISGSTISLVQIDLQNDTTSWTRWVFDDPSMNRDVVDNVPHEDAKFIDENIAMQYAPAGAPITIVGGLGDGSVVLLTSLAGKVVDSETLIIGTPTVLTEDISLTLDKIESHTHSETRPTIVPKMQRDPSASNTYSMVEVAISTGEDSSSPISIWLPYHHYPFNSQREAVHRFMYNPTMVQLQNGKLIELMFSRQRTPLPTSMALEGFEIVSHLGGFSGRTSSILNWRSVVRLLDGSQDTMEVSVNEPKKYGEFWFFQSQWDPPDSVSQGLNYTVLGVGNRHGVLTMLLGCCLAVSGMLYAFYVKPMIKRKRQQKVYSGVPA